MIIYLFFLLILEMLIKNNIIIEFQLTNILNTVINLNNIFSKRIDVLLHLIFNTRFKNKIVILLQTKKDNTLDDKVKTQYIIIKQKEN